MNLTPSDIQKALRALRCPRGHEVTRENTFPSGRCRDCLDVLPVAPLSELIYVQERLFDGGAMELAERIADRLGASPRTIHRYLKRFSTGKGSIHVNTADRLVIAMRSHPALLWPDRWAA
jgi:hypothetical protein